MSVQTDCYRQIQDSVVAFVVSIQHKANTLTIIPIFNLTQAQPQKGQRGGSGTWKAVRFQPWRPTEVTLWREKSPALERSLGRQLGHYLVETYRGGFKHESEPCLSVSFMGVGSRWLFEHVGILSKKVRLECVFDKFWRSLIIYANIPGGGGAVVQEFTPRCQLIDSIQHVVLKRSRLHGLYACQAVYGTQADQSRPTSCPWVEAYKLGAFRTQPKMLELDVFWSFLVAGSTKNQIHVKNNT